MFLVLFILFHMSMNITAIISPEAYNMICELLGANWYALAGTAVLALGVFVHFFLRREIFHPRQQHVLQQT